MKINKLRPSFFIIIISLFYFTKRLIFNGNKKFILRKLDPTPDDDTHDDDKTPDDDDTPDDDKTPDDDDTPDGQKNKEDENIEKYEECQEITTNDPADCFDVEFDFKNSNKKCCYFEFKDKKYDNKRKRKCRLLEDDEFLDIKKTIKKIQEDNKNYTVLSLECDKSNILFLNKFLLLILLLLPL